jgi:hypothetical protein
MLDPLKWQTKNIWNSIKSWKIKGVFIAKPFGFYCLLGTLAEIGWQETIACNNRFHFNQILNYILLGFIEV